MDMIAIGTIAAIRQSSDGIRIDARVHKELRKDLLVYGPVNVIASISTGDRVVVHGIEGNDVEQFATPIQVMPDNGSHRIIADAIEARSSGGDAAFLALKSDVQAIKDVLTGFTPVGGDGGAALKTFATTQLASIPAGTTVFKAE